VQLVSGVLGGVALASLVATPASAVDGSIGLQLLDIPAKARDDPRARIYVVDHLAPGTVIRRRVEVSNTSAAAAHLVIYPAAATIEGGSFRGAVGHTPNELSSWTSVRPGGVDVPGDGHATATVTITVPRDAAPGEQYGVVWVEARSQPVAEGGVTRVSRVGIRLYVSVGPGGPPAAGFTIDSLTAQRSSDGRPTVLATVHNTGGRALDMSGTLRLSAGPGGLSAGPFPAGLGTTLGIGDTEDVTIALDKRLPAGPWNARITLHSGFLEHSAQATISFPKNGAGPAVKTTSARAGWLYLAVGAVAVLLLSVALLIVKGRRGRSQRRPVDGAALDEFEPASSAGTAGSSGDLDRPRQVRSSGA
jgi:hypothetical protein